MADEGGMLQANDLRTVRAASAAEAERRSAPDAPAAGTEAGTAAAESGAAARETGSAAPENGTAAAGTGTAARETGFAAPESGFGAAGPEPVAPESGTVAPDSAPSPPDTSPAAFDPERAEPPVQLDFLRQSAEVLEVPDPFAPEFAVAGGEWRSLRPAAAFWRAAADALRDGTSAAAGEVSGIEASWDGAAADGFIAGLRRIGASGGALAEAADALAAALDAAADALHEIAGDMRRFLTEVAAGVHAALREPGADLPAAREHLMRARRPAAGLAESVHEVMARLQRSCAEQRDVLPPVPTVTADGPKNPLWTELASGAERAAGGPPDGAHRADPGATGAASTTPAQAEPGEHDTAEHGTDDSAGTTGALLGGGMVGGMMPLAGMAGLAGAGGAAGRRGQRRPRPKADPAELFGVPPAVEPVLGDAKKKRPE